MDVAISIIAKISEYTVGPISCQLGYLVFYNNNVKGLKEQLPNLVAAQSRVQHMVDEAKNQVEDIEDDVQKWLSKVDEIMEEAHILLTNIEEETKKTCSNGSCFNLPQRHQLSRKAKKITIELAKIQDQGNFNKVGYQGPLSWIENISGYQPFESRMTIMEGIMEALKDPNISMIGVHGMGGIGKTTLVQEISCQVRKSKLFEQVLMAIVGQNPDVKYIQGQLADMLNIAFQQETEQGRAAKLRKRLQMEKKIFIIFDDIWNGLDLERIGIPPGDDHKGTKILVTSRYKQVLTSEMNIEENFELKDLAKEESWKIFKNMVDEKSLESDLQIKQVAREIVDKCGKLPIALATLVKALKGKPFYYWKDALRQLRHPATANIEGISKEVYASIKLSYDFLSSHAQLLFLLCSMFPDDYDIGKVDLSRYVLGMRLLEGIETLEATRDRTLTLIDDLESSNLLQNSGSTKNHMRMHDVVRDVAIYIASTHDRICTLSYGKAMKYWEDEKTHKDYTAFQI